MYIHKEGRGPILVGFVILAILVLLFWLLIPSTPINWILSLLAFIFFGAIVSFFRIPDRKKAINDRAILSAADGKVVVIEETTEPEYFKDKRIQVSVFMSPLNVHVNKNPISGTVQLSAYHPGKYLVAWHPKSSLLNERHTNVIRHEKYGDILVRQIAGAVARRIRNYLTPGMEVTQSEELGFIKFGSRVDLFLPLDARVRVKIGDQVKYGEVIAEFNSPTT